MSPVHQGATVAGFLTTYSNDLVLDHLFGATAARPPAKLYFGLSQTPANRAGQTAEPSGGGYARVALGNTDVNFPGAVGGRKWNGTAFAFPGPTADWGLVRSLFVADAGAGGNVLAMADLVRPRRISGGGVRVEVGGLVLTHS